MMKQVLAAGVQHGEEADLGTQVLGIGSNGAQGLGGGTEEQAVDKRLDPIGNVAGALPRLNCSLKLVVASSNLLPNQQLREL